MGTRSKTRTRQSRLSSAAEDNGHVQDGTIVLQVQGGKHDGKTIEMDPMVVKLAAERLELKHQLEVIEGQTQATAEFAVELSGTLETLGYESTPAIAIRAWQRACEHFATVQKKTR